MAFVAKCKVDFSGNAVLERVLWLWGSLNGAVLGGMSEG